MPENTNFKATIDGVITNFHQGVGSSAPVGQLIEDPFTEPPEVKTCAAPRCTKDATMKVGMFTERKGVERPILGTVSAKEYRRQMALWFADQREAKFGSAATGPFAGGQVKSPQDRLTDVCWFHHEAVLKLQSIDAGLKVRHGSKVEAPAPVPVRIYELEELVGEPVFYEVISPGLLAVHDVDGRMAQGNAAQFRIFRKTRLTLPFEARAEYIAGGR